MRARHASNEDYQEAERYEIRINGHLDDRWADWFEGLTITRKENGETLLTGPMADQAALHGVLKKLRDLGILLLSVNHIAEPDQTDASDTTA